MNKYLSFVLTSCMVLQSFSICLATEPVTVAESDTTPSSNLARIYTTGFGTASGTCGENLTWTLVESTGVLTIDGSGDMFNYALASSVPWCQYRGSVKSLVIGESVTSIGDRAFSWCDRITTVTIPNSVKTIGKLAFESCYDLVTVIIPDSVTAIHYGAFMNCSSLASLIIPDSVESISTQAFFFCKSLSSITIPGSITKIGYGTFHQCSNLTAVYFGGTEAQWNNIEFDIANDSLAEANIYYKKTTLPEIPDWAKTYTDFVADHIMPDISGENYGEHSSRGLIAQSLYNMSGNNAVASSHGFIDAGDYDKAIAWCKEHSVMNGLDPSTFGTDSPVTREQFALILMQLTDVLGKTTVSGNTAILGQFKDVDSISSWASHGVSWAVTNGLMAGSDGYLNPQGQITRAEVAVMLYHFQ